MFVHFVVLRFGWVLWGVFFLFWRAVVILCGVFDVGMSLVWLRLGGCVGC